MHNTHCKIVFLTILIGIFFLANSISYVFAIDESDVRSSIIENEEKIVTCYNAVKEANEAGANVTNLLSTLNVAGELLSKAKLAYSYGDYASAKNFSDQSKNMLKDFVDKAKELKENAEQARYWDFMLNFVGSALGALTILVGGFVLWTFLKKREKAKEKA
jgi:hypothetical protein